MKNIEAIALPSVRHADIVDALSQRNLKWNEVAHVAATTSLADEIRDTGVMGLRILALIEMVVMEGLGEEYGHAIKNYPSHQQFFASREKFEELESEWWSHVSGRRAWQSIVNEDALRKFLRSGNHSIETQNVIIDSRQEFKSTIQQLASSGVNPQYLKPNDAIAKAATDAWVYLEGENPTLSAVREDLWMSEAEFIENKTPKAQDLRSRLLAAINQLFGKCEGQRTIVYHGFYFYTPPQWALFQLLKHIPEINQIFVVHDDGKSDVFEIWREFFSEKVSMPVPHAVQTENSITHQAAALRNALTGQRVDESLLTNSLEVLECKSPTHFVRQWIEEKGKASGMGKEPPLTFAPAADEIDRYVARFGGGNITGRVDLTQLPIGIFLLRVHECITLDSKQNPHFSITAEALIDIVASGFLETSSQDVLGFQNVDVLQRAMPFFRGCKTALDWQARATSLRRLVAAEVSPRGERKSTDNDVARIESAAGNTLRLAPWADLSNKEAEAIENCIHLLVSLLADIAQSERAKLKDHLTFLKSNLKRGMSSLPVDVQGEINGKIEGMNVGVDIDISIDGLIGVVQILLSRKAEFDLTGGKASTTANVRELRDLDVLGFRRQSRGVHVANLADGVFPSRVSAVSWPYNLENLSDPNARVPQVTRELLEMRARMSALADLYLLWLALDGAEPGEKITLSYIAEIGSDIRNPSVVLALLTEPTRNTTAIASKVGGLEYVPVKSSVDSGPQWSQVISTPVKIASRSKQTSLTKIDQRALASSVFCARRFALQWVLGPTTAFQSEHHHSILFGNVRGSLVRHDRVALPIADRIANGLWMQFTIGERESSKDPTRCRIPLTGPFSKREWLLTLGGSKERKTDPLSLAYQAAIPGGTSVDVEIAMPSGSGYLPPRNPNAVSEDICKNCPVKVRCFAADDPDERG